MDEIVSMTVDEWREVLSAERRHLRPVTFVAAPTPQAEARSKEAEEERRKGWDVLRLMRGEAP